ncbi:MAG: hypothetical protein IKR26_02630, partial [Lachnospiraceae bacterium]|nr:hypothetical protein [Lachnospiraceae bacterium]
PPCKKLKGASRRKTRLSGIAVMLLEYTPTFCKNQGEGGIRYHLEITVIFFDFSAISCAIIFPR